MDIRSISRSMLDPYRTAWSPWPWDGTSAKICLICHFLLFNGFRLEIQVSVGQLGMPYSQWTEWILMSPSLFAFESLWKLLYLEKDQSKLPLRTWDSMFFRISSHISCFKRMSLKGEIIAFEGFRIPQLLCIRSVFFRWNARCRVPMCIIPYRDGKGHPKSLAFEWTRYAFSSLCLEKVGIGVKRLPMCEDSMGKIRSSCGFKLKLSWSAFADE